VRHTWNNFGAIGTICLCFIVIDEYGCEHLGFMKGKVFLDRQKDFSAPQGGLWSVGLTTCMLALITVI
jgi:hypothetical protein